MDSCVALRRYPGLAVESVTDSSRYFVLRLDNGSGQHAFVGMGFTERSDAFDFNVTLRDHFKREDTAAEIAKDEPYVAKHVVGALSGPIKINIKRKDGAAPKKANTAGGLQPPPGGLGGLSLGPPPGGLGASFGTAVSVTMRICPGAPAAVHIAARRPYCLPSLLPPPSPHHWHAGWRVPHAQCVGPAWARSAILPTLPLCLLCHCVPTFAGRKRHQSLWSTPRTNQPLCASTRCTDKPVR